MTSILNNWNQNKSYHNTFLLTLFSCCALLAFGALNRVGAQINPALDGKLQAILDEARSEFSTVGVAMGIHIPGRYTWSGSSGLNDLENETPLRPDHLFRVGSITKTFTSATILLLAEDGVLDIEDTVEHWLPGLVPNGTDITIRHLLNHTSGVFNYTNENSFWESTLSDPGKIWGREEVVSLGIAHDLDFDPGTRWNYSNTGYTLLGMIIESATGTPLIDQIRTRLLDPLELRSTFLPFDEEVRGEIAHGYFSSGGQLLDTKSASYTALETAAWSAGAIVSTVGDLVRWADALYGGKILKPATMDQMLTFSNTFGSDYGLGVQRSHIPLGLSLGHGGGITGFISSMDYVPEQQIAISVLTNQDKNSAGMRDFALRRIMQLGELFPAETIQILSDDLANGWSAESVEGAEPVQLISSGPINEGDVAASVRVTKPARFSGRWKVQFAPESPLLPLGYTAVHLAIHPGDLVATATSNLSIAINGATSSENFLRSTTEGLMVDVNLKEWQIIEVPIYAFGLSGPIEHIDVQGNVGGTFYIDDVQLVAAPHPPSTAVMEDQISSLPQDAMLSQNYPNPFNSSTIIRFSLPQEDNIKLAVFNMAGQQVTTLVDGQRTAGSYAVYWDGRDDNGQDLASGIYLYHLHMGSDTGETRKLLLLR